MMPTDADREFNERYTNARSWGHDPEKAKDMAVRSYFDRPHEHTLGRRDASPPCGAPFEIGCTMMRWHERVMRWSDRRVTVLEDKHVGHGGWYTRSDPHDKDDVVQGVVVKLPSRTVRRKGHPTHVEHRFLVGYNDPCNSGGACLSVECEIVPAANDSDHDDVYKEAYRAADRLAECVAEEAREYDDAWIEMRDLVEKLQAAITDWQGESDPDDRQEYRDKVRDAISALRSHEEWCAKHHDGLSRRDV